MIERWLSYHVLGSEVWRYGVVLLLFLGAFVLYRLFRIIARRLSPPEAENKVRWAVLNLIQSPSMCSGFQTTFRRSLIGYSWLS
jgi:hypothetical protein